MTEILIAIPVLGRPHRAASVHRSASKTTDVPHAVVFLASPGDRRQRLACAATGARVTEVSWPPGRGDWAMKINAAYRASDAPWIFLGADDLVFGEGWASEALRVAEATGAGVVGTCDGGNNPRVRSGQHSTHPLVSRRYADEQGTIDGPGAILCELYDHQWADDELVETAKSRGEWAFAEDSCVEHLHPYFGGSPMDATYEKALRETRADRALFMRRRRLWA